MVHSTIFSNTQVENQSALHLLSPPSPSHLPTVMPPNRPSNLLLNMTGLALIIFLLCYYTLLTNLPALSLSPPIRSAMPPKQSSYKIKNKITHEVCLRFVHRFPFSQYKMHTYEAAEQGGQNQSSRAKPSGFKSQFCQLLSMETN